MTESALTTLSVIATIPEETVSRMVEMGFELDDLHDKDEFGVPKAMILLTKLAKVYAKSQSNEDWKTFHEFRQALVATYGEDNIYNWVLFMGRQPDVYSPNNAMTYTVANYQYSVIRRSGYYVPLEGKILTAEAFVQQSGRPKEVCISVPMYAGESDDCQRWRAHDELKKLVGGFYTQIYEIENIAYQ
jgi:hypothetical protein